MRRRLKPIDAFAGVNAALFVVVGAAVLISQFRPYQGPANLLEFLAYSFTIAVLAAIGWRMFQRTNVPAPVLAFMQLGIMAHFAGGFLQIHGARLYDTVFLGVGYDKYVHVLNGLAGAMLVDRLIPRGRGPVPRAVVVVMVMMGAGAFIEMIEYAAQLLIRTTGVGGYDNNMRDLFANMAGGLIFVAGGAVVQAARHRLAARRERPA